jgi:hypothetical protein
MTELREKIDVFLTATCIQTAEGFQVAICFQSLLNKSAVNMLNYSICKCKKGLCSSAEVRFAEACGKNVVEAPVIP